MLNTTSIKTSTKRKAIEESVLQKARKFVSKPTENEVEVSHATLAVKKPRHTVDEKLQAKLQKSSKPTDSQQTSSKKKSKNKKKKRKKQLPKEKDADQEIKRQNEALCYLKLWEKHRDQWKFEKLKQIWLLKNALRPVAIDDNNFKVLLNYVSSIKGHSRSMLLTEMQTFVEDYESKHSSNNEIVDLERGDTDTAANSTATDFDKLKYGRARKFVQMLSDD